MYRLRLGALLLWGLCLLSCRRIPLHEPDSGVYLKLNLQLNTEVSVPEALDLSRHPELAAKVDIPVPQMVHVCFYNPQTHALSAEDFLPAEGGFIHVAPGTYDIMVYSLGNEVTQVDGVETRGMARAFTSALGTRVKVKTRAGEEVGGGEYDVIYEPDHLLVGRLDGVVIPLHAADDGSVIVIDDKLDPLLETYAFEMPNVTGVQYLKSVDVYITGQATSRYLWDRRFPSKECAIGFPASVNAENGGIYTVFNTFGKFPDVRSQVYLHMVLTGPRGEQYRLTYDVTEQFNNPDKIDHQIIVTDVIDIPEGGTGATGFTPTVSDWDVEIINIELS